MADTAQEERVDVVAPDGTRGTVPISSLEGALRKGFRTLSPEESLAQAKQNVAGKYAGTAALTGLLRGATFGVSDVLARNRPGADPEQRAETLRTIKEASPVASTLGEVGGNLALAPLTGGLATGVARAATAGVTGGIAKQIAARAAAAAVTGGAEGAVFGAGQVVSEDALGESELTAENLFSRMGKGALWGAALAGAGTVAMEGTPAIAGAMAKKVKSALPDGLKTKIREGLDSLSKRRAFKTAEPDQRTMDALIKHAKRQGLDETQADEMVGAIMRGENLTGKRLASSGGVDAVRKNVTEAKQVVGEMVGDFRKKVHAAAGPDDLVDVHAITNTVRREVAAATGAAGAGTAKRIDGILRRIERKFSDIVEETSAADKMTAALGGKAGAPVKKIVPRRAALKELRQEIKALDGQMPASKWRSNEVSAYDDAVMSLRGKLNEAYNDAADTVAQRAFGADEFTKYRRATHEFGVLSELDKGTFKAVGRDIKNRVYSLTDYQTGLGAAVMTGSPLTGLATATGHHLIRKYGADVSSRLFERAAKLNWLASNNARSSGSITKALEKYTKSLAGGAKAVGIAAKTASRQSIKDEPKTYAERSARAQRMAEQAPQIAEMVTRDLVDAAPKTATMLQTKIIASSSFLASKLPKPPPSSVMRLNGAREWEPSDHDKAKWMRYEKAVSDPMSVVADLHAGTLSREGVEALKTVYPQMYNEIVTQLQANLSEIREAVPYEQRIQLGMLFNVPTDPTLEPQFIATIQTGFATEPQPEEAGGQGMVRPSQSGLKNLNFAGRHRSGSEDTAGGLDA